MSKRKESNSKVIRWFKSIGNRYFYISLGARNNKGAMTSYCILTTKKKYPPIEIPIEQTEEAGFSNTQLFCVTRVSKKTAERVKAYLTRGDEVQNNQPKEPVTDGE